MKTLEQAIYDAASRSGDRMWHDLMGGAMIERGDDLEAIAEVLAFIYEEDKREILDRLQNQEGKTFTELRRKQYENYKTYEQTMQIHEDRRNDPRERQ